MTPSRLRAYLALAWCGGVCACGTTYSFSTHQWWEMGAWAIGWVLLAVVITAVFRGDRRSGVLR